MLVFSRVICSNHLEKLLLVRQNFRSFIGNLTADYVIRTEAFIHLFWVLTHVVTNLQPAAHGKLDPAVLASLPPSMQLDLLVQVRLIMDTAHKTLIYLYIYIYTYTYISKFSWHEWEWIAWLLFWQIARVSDCEHAITTGIRMSLLNISELWMLTDAHDLRRWHYAWGFTTFGAYQEKWRSLVAGCMGFRWIYEGGEYRCVFPCADERAASGWESTEIWEGCKGNSLIHL